MIHLEKMTQSQRVKLILYYFQSKFKSIIRCKSEQFLLPLTSLVIIGAVKDVHCSMPNGIILDVPSENYSTGIGELGGQYYFKKHNNYYFYHHFHL